MAIDTLAGGNSRPENALDNRAAADTARHHERHYRRLRFIILLGAVMASYRVMSWGVGEAEDVHDHGWISGSERSPQDAIKEYLELHYADLEYPRKGTVFCAEYPDGEVKEYEFSTDMQPVFHVDRACT